MDKKIKAAAGMLAAVLALGCMAGCGKEQEKEDAGDSSGGDQGVYDLTAEKWEPAGKLEESSEEWSLTAYESEPETGIEEEGMINMGKDEGVVDGLDYYALANYVRWGDPGEGYQKYYLTHMDMRTAEWDRRELALSGAAGGQEELAELAEELAADLDEGWAMIKGMDALDGKIWLLVTQIDRESRMPVRCSAVRLDQDLRVESVTDLLPEMQKAGMYRENMVPDGILCGPEGHLYVGSQEVGIFDGDGSFLKMVEAPGSREGMIYSTCRLPDGRPVFEFLENGSAQPVLFCLEGLDERLLYEGECDFAQTRFLNEKGEVLFVGQGGLVRWNAATGAYERIFRDTSLDPLACQAIVQTAEDAVCMVFYSNDETFALKLERDAQIEEKKVVVWQLFGWQDELSVYADKYSREHPGVAIELVTVSNPDDDRDMAVKRLMTRLAGDEMPDLFWMQREQLAVLWEKGILADLQEILPREQLEQIFPGVLRYCREEDMLYGINIDVGVNTLLVSDEVWKDDTWSFRDVMELAEEAGVENVFGVQTYDKLLYDLVVRDIVAGTSTLADAAGRSCSFDTEEFVQILEFCRKYGCSYEEIQSSNTSLEEEIENLRSGKSLAIRAEGNLGNFSRILAALGDGYKCAGFPTEGGYASYLSSSDCMALSADSDNREEAAGFLEYLLGSRVQRSVALDTVRRDVLINNVKDGGEKEQGGGPWVSEEPYFSLEGRAMIPLEGKPDGSSFLEEYLEILEQAAPMSSWIDELGMMIIEEAEAYFAGDKPADEVAKVIQSRVWLYLNEK